MLYVKLHKVRDRFNMTIEISKRVNDLSGSETVVQATRARKLISDGIDIVSFDVGQPDYDTPLNIKGAAIDAIQEGHTKYTPIRGETRLLDAICQKINIENKLNYEQDQIIASNGAKQSLFNAMASLLDRGDEVIIIKPYWPTYKGIAEFLGAVAVYVDTSFEQDFIPTKESIEKAITPKTKMLILNSPNNPTGMSYNEKVLTDIADILLQHPKIAILSDEVYDQINHTDTHIPNILNIEPRLYDRTVLVYSVSKTYAMTGWRLGFCAAPKPLIQAMTKIQSQTTSAPCSISQWAACEALSKNSAQFVSEMVQKYTLRRDLCIDRLDQIDGLRYIQPTACFYFFVNAEKLIQKLNLEDDIELASHLLHHAHVSVVAGSAFGMPMHIRISYAISKHRINEGFDRIAAYISQFEKAESADASNDIE